jgi:hypothetical protein
VQFYSSRVPLTVLNCNLNLFSLFRFSSFQWLKLSAKKVPAYLRVCVLVCFYLSSSRLFIDIIEGINSTSRVKFILHLRSADRISKAFWKLFCHIFFLLLLRHSYCCSVCVRVCVLYLRWILISRFYFSVQICVCVLLTTINFKLFFGFLFIYFTPSRSHIHSKVFLFHYSFIR